MRQHGLDFSAEGWVPSKEPPKTPAKASAIQGLSQKSPAPLKTGDSGVGLSCAALRGPASEKPVRVTAAGTTPCQRG